MELPSTISSISRQKFSLKKFLTFFPKKSCSEKISYIFLKKSLIFWKRNPPQNSHISGNGTFLYFGKGIFRTLAYSEPWHVQNHGIFRTRDIFRTLPNIYDGMFCINSYLARLKKVLIFSYISGNGNPEKTYYIFSKESCFYIPGNRDPEKIHCVSGNGNSKKLPIFQEVTFQARKMKKKLLLKSFLYFRNWNFLIFQEVTWKAWKSKKFYTFSHKEAKFPKLKYFLTIIIKCFFSFYNIFFYT